MRLGIRAPENVAVHRREIYDELTAKPDNFASHDRTSDHEFMRAALDEAKKSLTEGGLPIGAVLIRDNVVIGRGHNRRVQDRDPMAHAEIDCLRNAGRQKTYKNTVLYSTLMPCHLCSGAVVQFGVPTVILGESANYPGCGIDGASFMKSHGIEVIDMHDAECIAMMTTFIRENPALWNEDIGVDQDA